MTREETADLLEFLIGAYPNTKIQDAELTLNSWLLELGSFSAEAVYKSARFHIHNSKFFPTPSEIIRGITRAQMVYNESPIEINKLEAEKPKKIGEEKPKTYQFFQADGSTLTFNSVEELDEWIDGLIQSEMERDI